MTLTALAFAAGAALLQQQAQLPWLAWLAFLPLCIGLAVLRWRGAAVFALAGGFLWAAACAHWRMADWLSPELEGRDLQVVGVVAALPALGERSVRFEFDVESAEQKLPSKIQLSWYRSSAYEDQPALLAGMVHPGERWRFTVRLRRPHGTVNPHGFDYQAWLLERGIGATGYVRSRGEQVRLGERNSFMDWIEKAREAVRDRFQGALGATPASGILAALAVGDQRAISGEEWQLFNRTGVTHLMSISGLHVTLISGLFAWLVATGWRRLPALTLYLPARKAAAAAAIVGALGYTLLAGFGVPAQRTFYMVTVVAIALWSGRIASPGRTLALALAAVVIFDPWAPLAPGLWLSFGAVMLIFYVASGWTSAGTFLAQWGRIQWAITVGLAPAVLLLFGQVSVAGPLANAVAIPAVSAVITPLALVAARRAVAQRRAGADGAGVRARAAGTATRRSLDHDARRRSGTRRAGPHFEPRAPLRRRPSLWRRGRQRRPGDRAVSARRRAHPPGPRGSQPRRQRPPRRRAQRTGELRGGCPGFFAPLGAPAER